MTAGDGNDVTLDGEAFHRVSVIPGPGHPHRTWGEGKSGDEDADFFSTVHSTHSMDAVRRLVAGQELTDADLLALGRLNFACYLQWYEPIVALWPRVIPHPQLARLLARHDARNSPGTGD